MEEKKILKMVDDMEAVESFIGRKGRFVGDMVHISIADLAKIIRSKRPVPRAVLDGWIEAMEKQQCKCGHSACKFINKLAKEMRDWGKV